MGRLDKPQWLELYAWGVLIQLLLYDDNTLLGSTKILEFCRDSAEKLRKLKRPLCGYDPEEPEAISRRETAENTLSWL